MRYIHFTVFDGGTIINDAEVFTCHVEFVIGNLMAVYQLAPNDRKLGIGPFHSGTASATSFGSLTGSSSRS